MRAMLTTGVSLVICFTLFGCDDNRPQANAPAAPVAVAATPPCNCRPAKTASVEPATTHHHRRHHHSWGENASYSGSPSYSESSSYTERSSSSAREYRPGDEEQDSSGNVRTEEPMAQTTNASADAWIDGYGRRHYRDYGPLDDEHPGLISNKDQNVRARAWHGYDSDCDNRID
jgi:hypothetical protein